MQHRASSLPRFTMCPSSAAEPEGGYKLDSSSQPSDEGTAAHEALALVVDGREPDLDEIAMTHGVDRKILGILVANGRVAWSEYQRLFPEPRVEVEVEGPLVRGRADVLHADTESLVILDWKSGWVRRHHADQLAGYAHAAVSTFGMPKIGKITTIVPWLRFGESDVVNMDAEYLEAFEKNIRDAEKRIGEVFSPGDDRCGFCPRALSCPAWSDTQRSAAASLAVMKDGVAATPEMLASLYDDSRALKRALENYEKALKVAVGRTEDGLRLPDDRTLRFVDTVIREIDPRLAWKTLVSEGLTDDDLNSCLSLGKTKLTNIVKERAPRGKKGKAVAALMEKLEGAGAVSEKLQRRLQPQK